MIVFGVRKGNETILISNGDSKLFGIFPDIPNAQERGIVFAFMDIREDKIVTITLPIQTAQELYNAGRIKFER